jgi:exodeoxyribonuclease V alpha subunit
MPFTMQLLRLISATVRAEEEHILGLIIDKLIQELDNGHSCVVLEESVELTGLVNLERIVAVLLKSGLVGQYTVGGHIALKPLALMRVKQTTADKKPQHILYITRYLHYEVSLAKRIQQLNRLSWVDPQLIKQQFHRLKAKAKDGFPNEEQLAAIKLSCENKLSIITGGPGTGKTTTVVLLLWFLSQLYSNSAELTVHICAPTGKAAARVKDSITANLTIMVSQLQLDIPAIIDNISYGTLHKLLGYRPNNIYFHYNQAVPLAADILIIDESSMISLPMFYKLLAAVDGQQIKHIIFLGDKNQLSSVEEGYVFASLINNYQARQRDLFSLRTVSELVKSKRNTTEISALANHVLQGDSHSVFSKLSLATNLALYEASLPLILANLFNSYSQLSLIKYINYIKQLTNSLQLESLATLRELFQQFNQLAILCLTNVGVLGADNLNLQVENLVKQALGVNDLWYTGRPIIILNNDYSLGLHNGDIGICLIKDNTPVVIFESGQEFIPEVLPCNQLAYAITIHKSQGSEFENVVVVLTSDTNMGKNSQELLSRELVYTAITRAKVRVNLYAGVDALEYAIHNSTKRNTGLNHLLSNAAADFS